MPKPVNGSFSGDLIAELLALRPYIEQILMSGRHDRPPQMADLEDAVQLVYMKALGHLHLFRPQEGGMKAWVACIARNSKIDALRTEQRQDQVFSSNIADIEREPVSDCTPERMARVHALGAKVAQAINEMPATLADVLRYVDSEEIEHEQIAKELGITKAAAKMRLSRARAALRKRIGPTEDHYSFVAPVPVFDVERKRPLLRKAMTFLGQVAHFLPPMWLALYAFPLAVRLPEDGLVAPVVAIASNPRSTIAEKPALSHTVAEALVTQKREFAVSRRDPPQIPTSKSPRQTPPKTTKSVDDFHVELPASFSIVDGQH